MITINQKGVASLVILFVLVLAVFIIWETNEYVTNYVSPPKPSTSAGGNGAGATTTFCATGEEGNCNDSNDVFLLTE